MSKEPWNRERKLYGNNARIDPTKHVGSLYVANMAAIDIKPPHSDIEREINDELTKYAHDFVNENKK